MGVISYGRIASSSNILVCNNIRLIEIYLWNVCVRSEIHLFGRNHGESCCFIRNSTWRLDGGDDDMDGCDWSVVDGHNGNILQC